MAYKKSEDEKKFQREYQIKNRKHLNYRKRIWRKTHPALVKAATKRYGYPRTRAKTLKRYGLTVEAFNFMVEQQGGICAICRKLPSSTLAVDHNHETGKVRGLLCNNCNLALGAFRDDILLLESALRYLKK